MTEWTMAHSLLANKIWDRLEALKLLDHPGGKPEGLTLRRTKAGRHQRSAGAWSWFFDAPNDPHVSEIGSQWSATEILKAKHLSVSTNDVGQTSIWPEPP